VGLDVNRESKSSRDVPEEAKGKDNSSKATCRETKRRFVKRSRHRYPLCSQECPIKRQRHTARSTLGQVIIELRDCWEWTLG
jgi:hypothetical protein